MSWNIKTPGDYINGPLTVAGAATFNGAVTVSGAANLNGAVNLNTAGVATVTLGASSSYGLLTGSGTNAASIYLSGATRSGFESKLNCGAAEYNWYTSSYSSLIATLNSTGLGVGRSPLTKLTVSNGSSTRSGITITDGNTASMMFFAGASSDAVISIDANNLVFKTGANAGVDNGTTRMTMDASGNLYLKTTSRLSSGVFSVAYVPGTSQGAVFQPNSDVSSPTPILFLNSSGSAVGSITTTASATAYNISSDYRLKEAVQPLVGGLARISALKPSIYKWKADGSNGEGFLAHELAEVVPLAVTGEKDAVNEDGSVKPQAVDLSKVVPVLVAAIQELTARVVTLENA